MDNQNLEFEEGKENNFLSFISKVWKQIKFYFSNAEPYIVRTINVLFFETSRLIRNFFKYAVRQITLKE